MPRHANNLTIPTGGPDRVGNRPVYIGSRLLGGPPVSGSLPPAVRAVVDAVQWLKGPNPTFHWCVLVGEYYHQLQTTKFDNDGDIYYDNGRRPPRKSEWVPEKIWPRDEWTTYQIGQTQHSDAAIQNAGVEAITAMSDKYHWMDNNCQNFVSKLLDKIAPHRSDIVLRIDGRPAMVPGQEVEVEIEPTNLFRVDPQTGEEVEVDPVTKEPVKNEAKIAQPTAEKKGEEVVANTEENPADLAMSIMNKETPTITKAQMETLAKADIPPDFFSPEVNASDVRTEDTTTSLPPN